MQFSTVLSVFTMALVAAAAPELQAREKTPACCDKSVCVAAGSGGNCGKDETKMDCDFKQKGANIITLVEAALYCNDVL
ncbi:hypothetical protein DL771_006188 [Monosporascus sp. 5C6A]|nr:hypothetical protein DL771_006188 [Monosporascus sp. 5C6A]